MYFLRAIKDKIHDNIGELFMIIAGLGLGFLESYNMQEGILESFLYPFGLGTYT